MNIIYKQFATNLEFGKFLKGMWKETVKYPWTTYKDPDIHRQFKLLSVLGTAALPEDKMKKVSINLHAVVEILRQGNYVFFSIVRRNRFGHGKSIRKSNHSRVWQ